MRVVIRSRMGQDTEVDLPEARVEEMLDGRYTRTTRRGSGKVILSPR